MNIRPLEVPDEDPLEVRLVADAVVREEFEPCSNMFPHVDGEVLNDEVIIIHSSSSTGEPKVFEPYSGFRLPDILGDVGRWSEALWEWHSLDASPKGPRSRAIRAGTPIVGSVSTPEVHFTSPLDGLARARVVCGHRHPMDIIIMSGSTSVADDIMSVLVQPEAFAHRRSV